MKLFYSILIIAVILFVGFDLYGAQSDSAVTISVSTTVSKLGNKSKPFLQFDASTALSFIALCVSIFTFFWTYRLAKENFDLSHRPYVYAGSFYYIENQYTVADPRVIILSVLNKPAKLISEKYEWLLIKNDKPIEDKVISFTNRVVYPTSATVQYTIDQDLKPLLERLDQGVKLIRRCKIKYSWLSSKTEYEFSAEWEYVKKDWQRKFEDAN